jgi:hypothetical protein
MSTDSIAIPAERIPPIATDMSGTSQAIAGVLFFVALVFGVAVIGAPAEMPTGESGAYDAGFIAGFILAAVIAVGVPGWFGFGSARNASRATRAAALAKSDPSYTWTLAGKWIIAADGAGVPRPELSFKISRKLRTMLLAVPRAEAREA